jgi:hypothetical protein
LAFLIAVELVEGFDGVVRVVVVVVVEGLDAGIDRLEIVTGEVEVVV